MRPARAGRPGRRYVIRGGHVMSMDPQVGDFVEADVLVEGKKIVAVGPQPPRRRRRGDRRARPHRDARLRRHAPPPVRDGAAQLPRRRAAVQRRQAARRDQLLRVHPRQVRAGVSAARTSTSTSCSAALSQLDAGVTTVHDISQIHHSPRALRRGDQGPRRRRPSRASSATSRARATSRAISTRTDARRIKRQYFSSERPAPDDDHGRRDLPARLRGRLGDRTRARDSRSRRTSSAPSAWARRSTRLPRADAVRLRQPVHSHDRHVGHGWQKVKRCRRRRVAGRADRDEHAPRHAADPEDAGAGHPALAERGRRVHADGRHVHADAHDDGAAARVRQPDGARAGNPPDLPGAAAPRATCCVSRR